MYFCNCWLGEILRAIVPEKEFSACDYFLQRFKTGKLARLQDTVYDVAK